MRDAREVDCSAIAKFVSRLKGPDVITTHSGLSRRVVIRRLLGRKFLRLSPFREQQRACRGGTDTVDEIAPRDLAVHSETAIVRVHVRLHSELKLNTYSRNAGRRNGRR